MYFMVKLQEYKPHKATVAMLVTSHGHDTRKVLLMQPHNSPNAHSAQEIPTKTCTKCGEIQPATAEYFFRSKLGKYGYAATCKLCHNLYVAENKERIAARKHAWQQANKARLTKKNRVYYATNKEQISERGRIYRDANKEKRTKRHKEYRAANKAKWAEYDRRRRSQKRSAEGSHTGADIEKQYKSQKGRCYYCDCKLSSNYHVDHVVPLSRGGSNAPENLVVACPTCNISKGSKLPHEWVQGGRLL